MDFRAIVAASMTTSFVAPLEWKKILAPMGLGEAVVPSSSPAASLTEAAATLRKIQETETMYEWFVEDPDCSGVPLTELRLCWTSRLTTGMVCQARSRQSQQASSSWSCPLHLHGLRSTPTSGWRATIWALQSSPLTLCGITPTEAR